VPFNETQFTALCAVSGEQVRRTLLLNGFARIASVLILAVCLPSYGALTFDIIPTFNDASMTAAGLSAADIASVHSAFNYAAQEFESRFSDPIHINITVAASPGTSILGQSSTSLLGTYSYGGAGGVRSTLINDATTASDTTANASLGMVDPTGGGAFLVSRAQGRALGLTAASDGNSDGTFTFGGGFSYTYDPNNRAVVGLYDFIGVAQHEITEIMGRIALLGQNLTGSPNYVPYDLFPLYRTRNAEPDAKRHGRLFFNRWRDHQPKDLQCSGERGRPRGLGRPSGSRLCQRVHQFRRAE